MNDSIEQLIHDAQVCYKAGNYLGASHRFGLVSEKLDELRKKEMTQQIDGSPIKHSIIKKQ